MKGGSITLSNKVSKDGEFLQLFTHEFAHFVDIYVLIAKKNQKDPSESYYRISWSQPTTKKVGESLASFVSGYAATNQYEDFAETFVFYIFHNQAFIDRALKNDTLRQKYLFMENVIFPSGIFSNTSYTVGKIPPYVWDVTKIPISLQKYLYSVK